MTEDSQTPKPPPDSLQRMATVIMTITVEDGPEDNNLRIRMTLEPQEIDLENPSPCEQAALKLFAVISQFAANMATKRLPPNAKVRDRPR